MDGYFYLKQESQFDTMESPKKIWDAIELHCRTIAHWQSINAILMWDQETYAPSKAHFDRAEQIALISGNIHRLQTESRYEENLRNFLLFSELPLINKQQAQLLIIDLERKRKLSQQHVEQLSRLSTQALSKWETSREKNDEKPFLKALYPIIELKKAESELIGYNIHPYDTHIQAYEPDISTHQLQQIFQELIPKLTIIDAAVRDAFPLPSKNASFSLDELDQWEISLDLLKSIGFDFNRGRQDRSTHPFTIRNGAHDIRLTTRIDRNHIGEMIWSCLHEGGHGLYEQGLDADLYGFPAGEAASLSVHESQSRLWENAIGRSWPFVCFLAQKIHEYQPQTKAGFTKKDLFFEANRLNNSLIRTQADEIRYHYHIEIRFKIECELLTGSLNTVQLKDAWNEAYMSRFARYPRNLKEGLLQDIHWAHGSFGYFPTYTLGSMLSAQLINQMRIEIQELNILLLKGKFKPIAKWLKEKIYVSGRLRSLNTLCHDICGEQLTANHLLTELNNKYNCSFDNL